MDFAFWLNFEPIVAVTNLYRRNAGDIFFI
jgi:hypothetical protein